MSSCSITQLLHRPKEPFLYSVRALSERTKNRGVLSGCHHNIPLAEKQNWGCTQDVCHCSAQHSNYSVARVLNWSLCLQSERENARHLQCAPQSLFLNRTVSWPFRRMHSFENRYMRWFPASRIPNRSVVSISCHHGPKALINCSDPEFWSRILLNLCAMTKCTFDIGHMQNCPQ